jgi:hypothetical protein
MLAAEIPRFLGFARNDTVVWLVAGTVTLAAEAAGFGSFRGAAKAETYRLCLFPGDGFGAMSGFSIERR